MSDAIEKQTVPPVESGMLSATRVLLATSPMAAVAFDSRLRLLFVNEPARELLRGDVEASSVEAWLASSYFTQSDLVERDLRAAVAGESRGCIHLVKDSVETRLRCVEVRAEAVADDLYVAWVDDVTRLQQLQQYRLFAEIGSLRSERVGSSEMAQRIVAAICDVLNVDIAVLTLRDRSGFRPVASRGVLLEPGAKIDPRSHPFLQKAIETGSATVADGSEWHAGGPTELTGVHYIVPLRARGDVVGTVHLGSLESTHLLQFDTPDDVSSRISFHSIDVAFLDALSGYAGAALANSRLFEENLEEQAKLATVVESIPEGIVVFDATGEVHTCNTIAQKISERSWSDMNTDVRPYRLRNVDGELLSRSEWPFFRAVRSGRVILNEVVVMDFGDHERFVEISCVPVPLMDSNVASFVGTMRDVTEQVQQQRRRDDLLSVASHELRSPLTPLTGFLQLIRKQVERGEEVDEALVGRAEQQVLRLARLLEILLDVTRVDSGRLRLDSAPIDVVPLVKQSVDPYRAHPRRTHEFRLEVPDHPVVVHADGARLEQVLTNLVDNAIRHSERDAPISLSITTDDQTATIQVADVGAGISSDALPHVFERFFSSRERTGPGMGLGLYISRQIVESHDGTIEVQSEEGEGTTVTVRLPLAAH